MWPGSHGVVVNPQEGLMEWSVFDMDPYVNPYVDFRGVALNPDGRFFSSLKKQAMPYRASLFRDVQPSNEI
jgi:hypothetical protein